MGAAGGLDEVSFPALDPGLLNRYVDTAELEVAAETTRDLLGPAAIWHVNSTAAGGGVAEILRSLLGYSRGSGLDTRWLVVAGEEHFFQVTKRLHNGLHGNEGDGGPLAGAERNHYSAVLAAAADGLRSVVDAGDIVVLHDPQTAGLVPAARAAGATVIWRCHIGTDESNRLVERSWRFLAQDVRAADAVIFSRASHVPPFLRDRARIIPPSIDPLSPKNIELDDPSILAILHRVGIVAGSPLSGWARFVDRFGSVRSVESVAEIVRDGPAPDADTPLVVQISRWDRLKDMDGVMAAFAAAVAPATGANLALVGPSVTGVSDDPEGAEVYNDCVERWRALPDAARGRIQLVRLPMADLDENGAIVNALQRHAAVVVQKSLEEGFGLTVTEAMWKARPIVASRVGGIQDQIVDGDHGLLIDDPTDLDACGAAVCTLLGDPSLADRLGRAARQRVISDYLTARHLVRYAELFADLRTGEAMAAGC